MLIQPDSYIRLIKNCPLDNKYEHTIYFNNPEEQEAYFKGLDGKPYIKQSYQRSGAGVITLQDSMANVYNCNYLMFNNLAFENKWFYAFVNKIEYVSNIVCRIYYDIDVVQTWFPFCTLEECFVEREHSATDAIGDNLVHENVYFGPYVFDSENSPSLDGVTMDNLSIVVAYNPALIDLAIIPTELAGNVYESNYYGGCYQGINFLVISATSENMLLLRNFLRGLNFLTFNGVVCVFMMPTMFLPLSKNTKNEFNTEALFLVNRNTNFSGYIPNNNKLFTYPYTCANLTSKRNEGNDFAFEYSSTPNALQIRCVGSFNASPSVMAYPIRYKGVDSFLEGSVTIPAYPLCTWGADGFSEWMNNNFFKVAAIASATAVTGTVAPASATASSMSASTPATSTALAVSNPLDIDPGSFDRPRPRGDIDLSDYSSDILGAIGIARHEFDQGVVHGSIDNDVMMGIYDGRRIVGRVKHITKHYAKIVDDYFTRFGYATNKVKKPNINVRPWWNYVKTVGCKLSGSVPAEDMRIIESLFDRGITFWNKNALFGVYDYSVQNNSPTGEE